MLSNLLGTLSQYKMHLLYVSLSLLLIGLVYVVLQKMEFFATNNSKVASLEHLQAEVMNLRRGQENTNKKLQSLNTRIKYGQIKTGHKSTQPVMPFSRETMESTPFFSIIGTGIYENISAGGDVSPTACQADEMLDSSPGRVVEITDEEEDLDLGDKLHASASLRHGKVLSDDKTSHNIHSEQSEFSDDETLPSLGKLPDDNIDEVKNKLPSLEKVTTQEIRPSPTIVDDEILEASVEDQVYDEIEEGSEVASLKTENLVLKGSAVPVPVFKKPLLKVKTNQV